MTALARICTLVFQINSICFSVSDVVKIVKKE